MLSPRWKKLWRDLKAAQGRMVMMVEMIGIGAAACFSVLFSLMLVDAIEKA